MTSPHPGAIQTHLESVQWNKRCCWCSYHIRNYKSFKSSVPGTGGRDQCIYFILSHTITVLPWSNSLFLLSLILIFTRAHRLTPVTSWLTNLHWVLFAGRSFLVGRTTHVPKLAPNSPRSLQESGYVPPILSPVFMSCYALCLGTGHHSAILVCPLAFTLSRAFLLSSRKSWLLHLLHNEMIAFLWW